MFEPCNVVEVYEVVQLSQAFQVFGTLEVLEMVQSYQSHEMNEMIEPDSSILYTASRLLRSRPDEGTPPQWQDFCSIFPLGRSDLTPKRLQQLVGSGKSQRIRRNFIIHSVYTEKLEGGGWVGGGGRGTSPPTSPTIWNE